jgi:hypothetical protein
MKEIHKYVDKLFYGYKLNKQTQELKDEILSNLWFSRPITISGPYQFAVLAVRYCTPLLTVFIPLLVSKCYKLIDKYEVKNEYEK